MLLAAAVLVLSCDVHGTETSPQGVQQTTYAMRYRFDAARRLVEFSNNGGPWRALTGGAWKVASWDGDRVVVRADKGTATFDLKRLTVVNHVVEHRDGAAIDQNARGTCKAL